MKTFKKLSVIIILMGFLSGVHTKANAQKYYAVFSAEEKESAGSSYVVQRLLLSHVFEITFCSNASSQLNKSFHSVQFSTVLKNNIRDIFEEDYNAYHSRNGYYVNKHYTDIFYFESYEDANRKRKEILSNYRNSSDAPKEGIKDISLKIPCRVGL